VKRNDIISHISKVNGERFYAKNMTANLNTHKVWLNYFERVNKRKIRLLHIYTFANCNFLKKHRHKST